MNKHRSIIGAAVVAALLAGSASAMADTTLTVSKTKHHYVYYKDRDVYFAPETKTYYWMANGSWRSGTTVPADYEPYVRTGGVTIDLDTERPYERHDYVIAHYKNAQPSETTTTERTVAQGPDATTTTTTTTTTKHKYVYYKDRDIYFAPETKTYYWLVDGNWRSGRELPAEDRAYVRTGGVSIELDTERPYERHDYVIAKYKSRDRDRDNDGDEDEEHH